MNTGTFTETYCSEHLLRARGDEHRSGVPGVRTTDPFVPSWVKNAVFYQIFPGRFANGDTTIHPPGTQPWGGRPASRNYFGGDLRGIIARLDYRCSLGATALYLNPIFASGTNHKY